MKSIASESDSTVSWDMGIGFGPSPLWYILSPQKYWSPKKGTIVVGHCNFTSRVYINETNNLMNTNSLKFKTCINVDIWTTNIKMKNNNIRDLNITPALNPVAVVPAPPWWTCKIRIYIQLFKIPIVHTD